jgi:hypothetical protein
MPSGTAPPPPAPSGAPPPVAPPPPVEGAAAAGVAAQPPPEQAPPPPPPPAQVEIGPEAEPAAAADEAPDRSAGPFSRGSIRLTLLLGTGSTVTETYFILGAGVGYFLLDGLEVGLDYEAWLFGTPVMNRLSPETRYVFHMVPVIKPYIGAFYRHTFVADYDDLDYVGGRAGAYYVPKSGRFYIGGGAVYERLLDCKSDSYVDCDTVYPEIAIGISL